MQPPSARCGAARLNPLSKQTHAYSRALGRVLGRRSMNNRYVRGGISATSTTIRSASRTGRILWLEIIGALCSLFVLSLGAQLVRMLRNRDAYSSANVAIAAIVLAIFLWFAVSSFWRARQLKRS